MKMLHTIVQNKACLVEGVAGELQVLCGSKEPVLPLQGHVVPLLLDLQQSQ